VRRALPDGFEVDDDRERIDVEAVHDFVSNHSYWAPGRPRAEQERLVREAQYRGHGLGVELIREMIENGPYADKRWILHTADAHALYEKFGFGPPSERVMERPRRP
jgi:GNAT superfamily N-acetyltransferase